MWHKIYFEEIFAICVVLLGFGLNLEVVMETGKQSLPIIVCYHYNIIGNFLYFASHDEYFQEKNLYTRWGGIFYLRGIGNRSNTLRLSMRMKKK